MSINMNLAGVTKADEGRSVNVIGHNIIYKATGAETEGAIFLWVTVHPSGAMIPPHIHRIEDEFVFVTEGELQVQIGEQKHSAKPGDLVKMPKGLAHGIENQGTATAKALWMVVPAGNLEGLFEELGSLPPDGPPDFEKILAIFGKYDIEPLPPAG